MWGLAFLFFDFVDVNKFVDNGVDCEPGDGVDVELSRNVFAMG